MRRGYAQAYVHKPGLHQLHKGYRILFDRIFFPFNTVCIILFCSRPFYDPVIDSHLGESEKLRALHPLGNEGGLPGPDLGPNRRG